MNRSKYLLWDFDGTLAQRPGQWTDTVMAVLRAAGLADGIDREQVRPFMNAGFPWHDHDRIRPPNQDADEWWRNIEQRFIDAFAAVTDASAERVRALAREVRTTYLDPSAWRVFDDAVPALIALSARGWQHIILSNHVPELPRLVAQLGLANHFDAIHTSALMGVEKPNREAFRHATALLPCGAVIWMIGDNPEADVAGAQAAGIPAILVRQHSPGVARCCLRLTDILDIVDEPQDLIASLPHS